MNTEINSLHHHYDDRLLEAFKSFVDVSSIIITIIIKISNVNVSQPKPNQKNLPLYYHIDRLNIDRGVLSIYQGF